MEMIGSLGLCLSLAGYMLVLNKKFQVISWFSPLLTVCGMSLVLYIGGLLGALKGTAYIIFFIGILCMVYIGVLTVRQKIRFKKPCLAMVCLGIGSVVFLLLVKKQNLLHYDNFSHWALIVKYLISTGKYPDAADTLISFKDYPVGTSVFIYYVCTFWGREEGIMLAAQTIIILSCFSAIFGIAREKRRFLLYSFLAMGCSMLSYLNLAIRINNLLVDFLLPLMGMASMSMTFRYRTEPIKASLCVAITLGFTGIIKNTGLVFAGIAFVFYLWSVFSVKKLFFRHRAGWVGITGGSVCLPYLLWKYHVNYTLTGIESKFRVSSLESANSGMHSHIFREFIRIGSDFSGRAIQVFILGNLLVMAMVWFAKTRLKKNWHLGWTLLLADFMIIIYYAGILGLYLYAMPEEEAVRLAGFERYSCSIMLLFAGILILQATVDIENSFAVGIDERGAYMAYSSPEAKRHYQYVVLFSLVLAFNFLYSEANGLISIQEGYKDSLPGKIKEILKDRWYLNGQIDNKRYLAVISDTNGQVSDWSVWYICRYFLFAPNVKVVTWLDESNIKTAIEQSDYIIILEKHAVNLQDGFEFLKEPGIYETKKMKK